VKYPIAFLGACFLAATAAHADTVYTSSAAYAAATGAPSTTINFNGIAASNSFVGESNPFTLSGSVFTFSPGALGFVVGQTYYGTSYAGGGFLSVDYNSPTDSLTVTLPSITALSFNYGGLLGTTTPFGIKLSDGFTTTLSTADSIVGTSTLDFAGFTSTSPLTSITFTLPDTPDYNALDNLSFASAKVAGTPEPSTLALLSTGLLGLAGLVRRKLRT
jgi:PEP-CTERM motif